MVGVAAGADDAALLALRLRLVMLLAAASTCMAHKPSITAVLSRQRAMTILVIARCLMPTTEAP